MLILNVLSLYQMWKLSDGKLLNWDLKMDESANLSFLIIKNGKTSLLNKKINCELIIRSKN